MYALFQSLLSDESGATALEYGLLATLVFIAILTALSAVGESVTSLLSTVSGHVDTAEVGISGSK